MASVFDPDGVKMFQMFSVDCGAAILGGIKAAGREPTPDEWETIERLSGHDLWGYRPTQRTGKVVDFTAMHPKELARKRDRERKARVERLAALLTPQKLDELEAADSTITDLLPPPEWVNTPDPTPPSLPEDGE